MIVILVMQDVCAELISRILRGFPQEVFTYNQQSIIYLRILSHVNATFVFNKCR